MASKGTFIVMAKVRPDQETAFNRWYDEDHMPKALNRFPGVIAGRRYKILDGGDGYNYMALYEFESPEKVSETMQSAAMKGLVQEFNTAFGDVDRKRIVATEIKAFKLK
jgi:antibiotic biosynthesis monooxygenase (ABM) superfamily enzyme